MQSNTKPKAQHYDMGNGRILFAAGSDFNGTTLNVSLTSATVDLTARGVLTAGLALLDFGQPLPADFSLKVSLRKPKPAPANG